MPALGDDVSVVYMNIEDRISFMPLEMLITMVPNADMYTLEHAALLAELRDEIEAENLLASILGESLPEIPYPISEGMQSDYFTIQPPTLR